MVGSVTTLSGSACLTLGFPSDESKMAIHRVSFDWAKRIIISTVRGADRNMPGMPQMTPQMASASNTTRADKLRESPIIRGWIKLPIENCQKLTMPKTIAA